MHCKCMANLKSLGTILKILKPCRSSFKVIAYFFLFSSCCKPLNEIEAWCTAIHMKMNLIWILTKLGQNVLQILSQIQHIFRVTSRRVKTTGKYAIVQLSSRFSQEPIRVSKKPDTLCKPIVCFLI